MDRLKRVIELIEKPITEQDRRNVGTYDFILKAKVISSQSDFEKNKDKLKLVPINCFGAVIGIMLKGYGIKQSISLAREVCDLTDGTPASMSDIVYCIPSYAKKINIFT